LELKKLVGSSRKELAIGNELVFKEREYRRKGKDSKL
jgi:hypothetical protein